MMAERPDLELPPGGTRGTEIPGPLRPLVRLMNPMGNLMVRFGVKVQRQPLLRLRTTGARTGKRRSVVLGFFPDKSNPDAMVVVASNGGSARHPGWAFNLSANTGGATVDTGDGEVPVRVEILRGEERSVMWDAIVAAAPGYGRYTEKTDREIPLFRLTPGS